MAIRRTLTSLTVAADLRRKLYADQYTAQTPFGRGLKRIEPFAELVLLYTWIVIAASIPVVLVLLLVGVGNFSVEWLWAAGIVLAATIAYIAVMIGLYAANDLAAGDRKGIQGIVGALATLISIGLLGWFFGATKSQPPSPTDIRLALFSGFWFAGLSIGSSLDSFFKEREKSILARSAALIGTILWSAGIILLAWSCAFDWASKPEFTFWSHLQTIVFIIAVAFSQISSIIAPPRTTSTNTRLASRLGALFVIGLIGIAVTVFILLVLK